MHLKSCFQWKNRPLPEWFVCVTLDFVPVCQLGWQTARKLLERGAEPCRTDEVAMRVMGSK